MSKGNSSAQSQPIVASNGHTEAEEPAAGAVIDALSGHWLWQMICDHGAKTDVAVCCCGLWRSAPMPSVGEAAKAWASHALSAAAQVAPSSEAPPIGAAGEAEAALSATDELTLSRLLAERREMLEALKACRLELYWCAKQLAVRGAIGHPGDSVSRAIAGADAILSASSEGKGE